MIADERSGKGKVSSRLVATEAILNVSPVAVKELRRAASLSQQAFAEALGVGIASVWRWENDGSPSLGSRVKILEFAREHQLLSIFDGN